MPQFNIDFQGIFERASAFLYVLSLVMGAVLAAFWVALIVWTIRDIRARSRDIFAQLLAVLLVALFPLIGLLLYLLMRPKETVAEAYDRALEEEALLQSLEERATCPKCHSKVEKDFILCPVCYQSLKKPCQECGRLLALEWEVCPYCGRMSEQPPPPPLPPAAAPATLAPVAEPPRLDPPAPASAPESSAT